MMLVNRAGYTRSNLSGRVSYESFVPAKLPPVPPVQCDAEMTSLLVKAPSGIAALDAVAQYVPDMRLFIAMYVCKEALMSSQIEGTQATLEDVLDPTLDANADREAGAVVKYVAATWCAVDALKDLPLCLRLLRDTHKVLMEGTRGGNKEPGEFRRSQNWIGGLGSTIRTASYVPPCVEDMAAAMSDLERYINSEDGADPLIMAALAHYQFETVHPFLDGNGRIGRMLITLLLMERRVISAPVLYISYFLKKHRQEYYESMSTVRRTGDYEQWVKFFLRALQECAESALDTVRRLTDLHEKDTAIVAAMGRGAGNRQRLLRHIETVPVLSISKTAARLGMSISTVSNLVRKFAGAGILRQVDKPKRRRVFVYSEYVEILKDGT